jgi:glycosyltransferase involved in cell wall biosynthesis
VPKRPSIGHYLLRTASRAGWDLRPLARRFRKTPVRVQLADATARIAELESTLAVQTQAIEAARDKASAEGADHRSQAQAANWAMQDRLSRLERHVADLHAEDVQRNAQFERNAWENIGRLDAAVRDLSLSSEEASRDIAVGATALRDLRRHAANQDLRLGSDTAEREALNDRALLLEQLLAGSAATRPLATLRAVGALADPAVSIILPSFNRAAFIGDAIASVQAQTFRNWELIIIDDGSTDETLAAVAPFLSDPRIRYRYQDNAHSAAARNRGVAETEAPLLAYIDSDNLWYPDFLSRAVDCLAVETDIDVVYGALVTDAHKLDRRCILWVPFDREALREGNFIDTNVVLHRRSLIGRYGGWDESLRRLLDWDLLLRYTAEKPARRLPVLAAQYRRCDEQSISSAVAYGPDDIAIRRKYFPPSPLAQPLRVLYVLWHYPQLSESYVEAELRCMLDWGVHVEIWCTARGVSPYPVRVTIHDGTFAEAVAAARPDIIHVQWLSFALAQQDELAACGLPVTLRLHGFDVSRKSLESWLAHDWVDGVYAFPNQIARYEISDARLKPMPVAFEAQLFTPGGVKDRRMVLRTSAGLPSKDLDLFFAAAQRLPNHRFVLVAATCNLREEHVTYLKNLNERLGYPVDLRIDVPRGEVVPLMAEAGIYLHTMVPAGQKYASPVGQPISIAEAMAMGCYCLVRDVSGLAELVEGTGASYGDLDEAVATIRATEDWTDADWARCRNRSIERAYGNHADAVVLQNLYNDWVALAGAAGKPNSGLLQSEGFAPATAFRRSAID